MLKGSHRELIKLGQTLVQPLLPNFYKGQAGKICIIGGCQDYTGAPYFAAHASATIGSDLTHVICETGASPVIKSYSPDLMVHPYLYDLKSAKLPEDKTKLPHDSPSKLSISGLTDNTAINQFIEENVLPPILTLLNRIDLVVVGPGFGRDKLMLASLLRIIQEIKVLNKPIIIDADALYLVSLYPELIQNYLKAILTPNVVEFNRLKDSLNVEANDKDDDRVKDTKVVSKKMGCTIVHKGKTDVIANNNDVLLNTTEGSLRRVGGQGDTLVGVISTLVNWSNNYINGVWKNKGELNQEEANLLAIYCASNIVRLASNKAFKKYGRAMQTSNVHEFLHDAYHEVLEVQETKI